MSRQHDLHTLEHDLRRLGVLVKRAALTSRLSTQDPGEIRILNLACGECHESTVLTDVFSAGCENPNPGTPSVELIGLDLRAPELARARQRDASRATSRQRFRYVHADASRLPRGPELPQAFDLVFLRHQNYWNGPEVWKSIFSNGLERLAPNGRLVITSYFQQEHRLAVAALEALGATVLRAEDHSEARILDPRIGKRVDGHIAVFQRPDGR